MKALVCHQFGPIDGLLVEDWPSRRLQPGEVRIAVKAAGINFPDALVVQGKYQLKPPLPFVPGSEFAGIVIETSPDVVRIKPGNRVFGLTSFGAFAEELIVQEERVNRMSDTISFRDAAVLSMAYGASMYALVDRGRLQCAESVLVLGATGGLGLAAVELAHLMGARVFAVDGHDGRLSHAKAKGADTIFNFRSGALRDAARAFAGERGFDLVFDPVGGPLSEEAIRCLGWKGRALIIGFASGEIPKIAANHVLLKSADVLGVFWGESQRRHDNNDERNFIRLLEWYEQGKIHPHIGQAFPLERGAEAIANLFAGKVTGKALIEVP
jgi:NADPH2:quinone reductase